MNNLVVINFGGPRNADEIYPFLQDLFRDPYLFDLPLPEFVRLPLADFIAKKRAPRVASLYASMDYNGGSPLVSETEKQAQALKTMLEKKTGEKWNVRIGMTCGFPSLADFSPKELTPGRRNIILPLFPHYSRSTVESAAQIIRHKINKHPFIMHGWIHPFYRDDGYIRASTQVILDYFSGKNLKYFFKPDSTAKIKNWQDLPIVFSAHGIPQRLIRKGDSYRDEIEDAMSLIGKKLREAGHKGEQLLSFQSKVGPVKWTEPFTLDTIKYLAEKGEKRIAVYPISFVSDHLETLEEIGTEFRHFATQHGIHEFYRIPAHGIHPAFIQALADIVIKSTAKIF